MLRTVRSCLPVLISLLILSGTCVVVHAVSLDDPAPVRIAEGTRLCAQADKLLAEGKTAEALAIYQEVLKFLPTSPRAKTGVAECQRRLKQPAKPSVGAATNNVPGQKGNLPGYLVPVDANVSEVSPGVLEFEMTLAEPPPDAPERGLRYIWFIDSDYNRMTGQQHTVLGSDYNVRANLKGPARSVFVDNIGAGGASPGGSCVVEGNRISVRVRLAQIGSPARFRWDCSAGDESNRGTMLGQHAPRDFEPPTSPSRVKALERARTVVLDETHEFLYGHAGIAEVLTRQGFDVITCNATLDTSVKLKDCGVLWLEQTSPAAPITFTPEEIALVTRYVEEGGSLVLIGNPDASIAKVAAAFGVQLKGAQKGDEIGSLKATAALHLPEDQRDVSLEPGGKTCYLVGPQDAETLIESSSGRSVAVGFPYGKGRVVCFAEYGAYWEFSGNKQGGQPEYPNAAITTAIFRSVLPPDVQLGDTPGKKSSVCGECVLEAGSVKVLYAKALEPYVKGIPELFHKIDPIVRRMSPSGIEYDQLTIEAWTTNFVGYSGGAHIYIGVLSCTPNASPKDKALLASTIAHEDTHSHSNMPRVFEEAWAQYAAFAIARELGFENTLDWWQQGELNLFWKVDPTGKKLDIIAAEKDPDIFGSGCHGKAMWMIGELERRFGPDFMPRFIKLFHANKWDRPTTVRDVLDYFSKAAGEDLTPWYHSIGIVSH